MGIYKSTDQGITWKRINNGFLAYPDKDNTGDFCYPMVSEMVIDPTNSQRLLMAPADITSGTINDPYSETAGIWETLDGGESWHQLVNGEMNAAGGAVAIDPNNPKTIYFGVTHDAASFLRANPKIFFNEVGILYKTTDGGITWEELTTGLLTGLQGCRVFVDHKNSNNLILITQAHTHSYEKDGTQIEVALEEQFGPMKSTDGGQSWTALADKLPEKYRITFEADVSPNDFDHIFVKPDLFPADKLKGLDQKSFYSSDGGETFKETDVYIQVGRFDPHDTTGNHMLGYTYIAKQVLESNDGGATWQGIGDLPLEVTDDYISISNFVWDPTDQNKVYMSGMMGYVWQSIDGGKTWKNILNLDKAPL